MRKKRKHINMLLATNYCESWGPVEVLREMVSNAADADENFNIRFPTMDTVEITTVTNPSVSNLLMMGSGTKTTEDDNRGQFGEGLKVGALVATRGRMNLKVEGPQGTFTFKLKQAKGFDEKSLHAILDPNETHQGCRISFKATGIADIFVDKFMIDSEYGPIPKKDPSKMRVFCKGVFVADFPETSLWDYNLKDLKLNRDRSMPDTYQMNNLIGRAVLEKVVNDKDAMDLLMDNQTSFEAKNLRTVWIDSCQKQAFREGFERKYGEKAAVASDNSHDNVVADYKGHKVIPIAEHMRDAFEAAKQVKDVLKESDKYTAVDKSQYTAKIVDIEAIMDICDVGPITLKIFEPCNDTLGYASDGEIGLCETLFMAGNKKNLYSTLIHELAHSIGNKPTDFTREFEKNLSILSGKLAVYILERK